MKIKWCNVAHMIEDHLLLGEKLPSKIVLLSNLFLGSVAEEKNGFKS